MFIIISLFLIIQILSINNFILSKFYLKLKNNNLPDHQTKCQTARPDARPKKIGLVFCQTKFFGLGQTAICPPLLATHLDRNGDSEVSIEEFSISPSGSEVGK